MIVVIILIISKSILILIIKRAAARQAAADEMARLALGEVRELYAKYILYNVLIYYMIYILSNVY